MWLAAIVAVDLTVVAMIVVAVMVLIMVAIVSICHKMFLIGSCMVMVLIAVSGVHMGSTVSVGMGFALGSRTAAGNAKHAYNGKKKKQLFHGFFV
jgi:hypothetical protein